MRSRRRALSRLLREIKGPRINEGRQLAQVGYGGRLDRCNGLIFHVNLRRSRGIRQGGSVLPRVQALASSEGRRHKT